MEVSPDERRAALMADRMIEGLKTLDPEKRTRVISAIFTVFPDETAAVAQKVRETV